MPQNDLASQWATFDDAKRSRILKKMTPDEKKRLKGMLEGQTTPAPSAAPSEPQTPGMLKSALSALWSDIKGIPAALTAPDPLADPRVPDAEKNRIVSEQQKAAADKNERRTREMGLPYSLGASANEMLGVNVEGEEEAAKRGDPGAVLGHAATVPVMMAAGEVAGRGLSKVGELRKGLQPFARKVTGVESDLKSTVTKAAEKHGEAVTENTAARKATMKENLDIQRGAKSKIEADKVVSAGKETAITEATNKLDEQSMALKGHLDKVEQSVKAEADAKFDKVREKLGVTDDNPGPEVAPETLISTVKHAQDITLQGIPESIKEFKAILQHEGIPENITQAVREHAGFEPEGPEPLTWSKLQSVKSRLDARLRAGISNGDVFRAVRDVRDGVVNEMGSLAEQHGAQAEWADAKGTWSQYKQDFHEATGPSGSGSPIAQALNAKDPANIRKPFVGNARARAIETLNKYPQHGGTEAAKAATDIVRGHQELGKLPGPGKVQEVHPLPENKPLPSRPEAPVIDAQKVAKDAIAKKAAGWGNMNARDIGILGSGVVAEIVMESLKGDPVRGLETAAAGAGAFLGTKYVGSRILSSPRFAEWLAKTPQAELDAITKIPGADKVKVVNTMTEAAVKAKAPNLSPGVRQLLGPANVARIMAASSAGVPKNRKEARELLGIAQ